MLPSVEENDEGSVETEPTSDLSRRFYRISRIVLGVALLVVGLVGLVLPILQGVVLIVAALAILRKDIPFAGMIWDRFVVPMQLRYRRWRDTRRSH